MYKTGQNGVKGQKKKKRIHVLLCLGLSRPNIQRQKTSRLIRTVNLLEGRKKVRKGEKDGRKRQITTSTSLPTSSNAYRSDNNGGLMTVKKELTMVLRRRIV